MSGTQAATNLLTDSDATSTGSASVAHAGTAVDAHGTHTGGAVSAHAGSAVDAHAVTQADAHAAHAAVDAQPTWYALIAIQRMT